MTVAARFNNSDLREITGCLIGDVLAALKEDCSFKAFSDLFKALSRLLEALDLYSELFSFQLEIYHFSIFSSSLEKRIFGINSLSEVVSRYANGGQLSHRREIMEWLKSTTIARHVSRLDLHPEVLKRSGILAR